jgi:arylsulfatase A-like enzyme/Flp pilus assembly protein TadD
MTQTRRLCLLALLLAALSGAACQKDAPPNVLLITVDTTRADRLGCYGHQPAHTPNIDRLAAEGVLCDDAIAAAPITMPSHATILTGLYPPAHGVRDNGAYALGDEVVTLAERLRENGYATQAFVSAVVLAQRYNLVQGFDGYDDDLWAEDDPKMFMIRDRPAPRTAERFVAWFESWKGEAPRPPFFAWVHFFDPHHPWEAPREDRRLTQNPYDAEISVADRGVGTVLRALREAEVLDDTLVILTADHGESLGEHGEKTHAVFIYDATVRVPFILRFPRDLPAGRVYEGPVRHVDVVPTVLETLGLPGADETQGVDLGPALRGEQPTPSLSQYSESLLSEVGFGMAPLYGVRKDGYKWIRAPRAELYDLDNDPGELLNLHEPDHPLSGELDGELQRILDDSEGRAAEVTESPMNEETMEMLQALGYMAPAGDRAGVAGMDPKDGILIHGKLEDARHLAQREDWEGATEILRGILEEVPGHVSARNTLGMALMKQRKLEEAKDQYLQSLAAQPGQDRVLVQLGGIALIEGDIDQAEKHYRAALEESPGFVEAMASLGLVAALRGDEAGAGEWYTKAVAVDPSVPVAQRRLGDLHYEAGRYEDALRYYEATLKVAPSDFRATIQAGNAARRVVGPEKAGEYYARAAEIRPDSWIPAYNQACVFAVTGNVDGALAALERAYDTGLRAPRLLKQDEDLASLRELEAFRELVDKVAAAREAAAD